MKFVLLILALHGYPETGPYGPARGLWFDTPEECEYYAHLVRTTGRWQERDRRTEKKVWKGEQFYQALCVPQRGQ